MEYQRLIWLIAEQTGVDEETVRNVLSALPEALMEGEIGEKTRTPLGVFTLAERQTSKPVKTPTGHWGSAQPMILARLKPGKKLRREASSEGCSSSSSPTQESVVEDPSA
jgi:hypothetical protein